jgi:4-amino-4-deoxy-L-arabinose transferase-like glycosyltransferase
LAEEAISRRARIALLVGAAILLLPGLGRVDAWAPDEPRYLQVAEEMRSLEHGATGLVLLHLGGRPYDQKPPLYFGLAALAGAPGGRVTEAAARLPSALAAIATVALTLLLGARLLGGRVGLLGGALLTTVFVFANLARRIQLDPLLTLLETAALALFWRADRGLGRRRLQVAGLHLCLGLAVLTKGPVGFLVPVLVMAVFLASEGRAGDLRRVVPLWALPLSLGPGLAWVAAAIALGPTGFAAGALGENLLGRFFAGTSHDRPFYYFLYQLPADFLPWTLLGPAIWLAGRRRVFGSAPAGSGPADERRRSPTDPAAERAAVSLHGERRREGLRRAWRFLLAWAGTSLVFFSLSSGKRGLYLLPVFPALALLLADSLCRELAGRSSLPRLLGAGLAVGTALVAGVGAVAVAGVALGSHVRWSAKLLAAVEGPDLLAFGIAVLAVTAGGAAAWVVTRRHGTAALRRLAIPIVGAWAVELAVFQLLYPALDAGRSPRPIAEAAAAATPPGQRVGVIDDGSMLGGLVYYGGRPVVVLTSRASIERFLAAGGRTFVVKERKLDRVTALTPVREVGRARTGSRTVVVVVARDRFR